MESLSQLYSEAVSDANAAVSATPEGVTYNALFETLFASRAKGLTPAEVIVLYPQFVAKIAPMLLRSMRSYGIIGICNGLWVQVAGNRELERARSENRLTNEEQDFLSQAM